MPSFLSSFFRDFLNFATFLFNTIDKYKYKRFLLWNVWKKIFSCIDISSNEIKNFVLQVQNLRAIARFHPFLFSYKILRKTRW